MLVVSSNLLEVSEKDEMALHLSIGALKPTVGWSRYRDANLVPTSPLADDIANTSSWRVYFYCEICFI